MAGISTRGIVLFGLALALFWLLIHSGGSSTEDITPDPPSHTKYAFRQRLVAVGDLHGDIDNAKKVLRMAKIIDTSSRWIAGNDILVQTGDIVDRGTYALDIYRMMQGLRGEAEGVGGKVISILGNHEIMNAIGDWRYVTQADIKQFGSTKERQEAISINGWLGKEWLANYSTTALVPLSPHTSAPALSFTHGSLQPSYRNLLPYPSKINEIGSSLLEKALTPPLAPPHPPYPYSGLPKSHTQDEADLYNAGGPLWWRGLAENKDDKVVCGWAQELRSKLGVRRIIGGHTPDFEKIVHRCNASIIIIDTGRSGQKRSSSLSGISSAYGGVLSALEIIYTLTPKQTERDRNSHHQDPLMAPISGLKAEKRYWEREEVYAIYERKRVTIAIEEREIIL